jgi:hypothetical protein
LPFHDKTGDPGDPDTYGDWSGPDWEDFLQQWTFTFGVKSTMF